MAFQYFAGDQLGALAVPGDVSVEDDARAAVARVVEEFGGIDILVNNAGFGIFAPLTEMTKEDFEAVFAVNVTGAMLMARHAIRAMQASGGGALGDSALDYYASLHRVAYYGDHTKSIRHLGDLLGLNVVSEV